MNYLGYPIINEFRSKTPAGFYDPVKGHTGIDLAHPEATAIAVPFNTKVEDIRSQDEMGKVIYLSDEHGNILVFAHLSEFLAEVGDELEGMQVFAKTGSTGSRITGAHLHFEVIAKKPEDGLKMMNRKLGSFGGFNIDPAAYYDRMKIAWATDALAWAREAGLIVHEHDPMDTVTWGEFAVILQRSHKKE